MTEVRYEAQCVFSFVIYSGLQVSLSGNQSDSDKYWKMGVVVI